MLKVNKFVIMVTVLVIKSVISASAYKLLLTVYYESKCPDTRSFVLQQLQPAVHLLHPYLRLKFVPFGKANSVDYGFAGFDCQHGQSECFGNMLQDCVLNLMKHRSDVEKVNYVACEVRTEAGTTGNMQCVEKANVTADAVRRCVEYGKGTLLQIDSEYFTDLVKPSFIPTITFDDTFNQQIQEFSLIDLKGTLCSFLKEVPPCAQLYNNMALRYILDPSYTISVSAL